jgi:ribosomal protein S18 acetylase RimI-like enzyme
MRIQLANKHDIPNWLALAAEVEHLFGPMVDNPSFLKSLKENIDRGTAVCVRRRDGPPGKQLLGAMLFTENPPTYRIGWLAVATEWRRRGVGRALVQYVLDLVTPPAEVFVTTFHEKDTVGREAVRFYRELEFRRFDTSPVRSPSGKQCQVLRRIFRARG